MTKRHFGTGLMAFWSDIDEDYLFRYQQWHNCEHVPERVSIPGFNRGRRYRDTGGAPHFLMMYETDAPAVLKSEAYLAALNAPTTWTQEALTHFRNPVRFVYYLVDAAGKEGPFCAPWITSLRFTTEAQADAEVVRTWLGAMAQPPGIGRVQLWSADKETSAIETSERKIYGGVAKGGHFLLLIESDRPHAEQGDPLAAADAEVPDLACRKGAVVGRYFLEIYHARDAEEAA